jgi:hypothetical protein
MKISGNPKVKASRERFIGIFAEAVVLKIFVHRCKERGFQLIY